MRNEAVDDNDPVLFEDRRDIVAAGRCGQVFDAHRMLLGAPAVIVSFGS
jgi:hypothetical protein